MADISSIVRNNPTAFSNARDMSKYLCSFFYKEKTRQALISLPKTPQPFQLGGMGGLPLIFDEENNKVFIDQTDKHSVTIGQTGSKKSRLVAMPLVHILGTAEESMIISDPKAEIYYRTSEYLHKKGYEIKVINLRNPRSSHGWNPLALPYAFYKDNDLDHAYEFANDIAINLTAIDKSEKDAFWDNSAGTLFFGLTLLLFKYCHEYKEADEAVSISNILELRNILFSSKNPESSPLWDYAKTDRFIESMLIGTVTTAEPTRQGILSVFDQKMRAFSVQPALLDMLSKNDSDYDFITEKPSAVYLILPDEKTGYHNLVSLYVKQSYEYMIYKAQNESARHSGLGIRVNYILDEFSSLPAISDFPAMITAARSRNIRFNLFLQSKKQLFLRYGDDCDTIMSNCENWIYLSSRELGFLKELSELCGDTNNTNRKPLLSVSDLQRLDKEKGQVLVLSGRNKPLVSHLPDINYYDNGRIETPSFVLPSYGSMNNCNVEFYEHINMVMRERMAQKMKKMSETNKESNRRKKQDD